MFLLEAHLFDEPAFYRRRVIIAIDSLITTCMFVIQINSFSRCSVFRWWLFYIIQESDEPIDDEMPTDERDVLEYMASIKRDEDMEKVANQLREKRGTESLMDKHSKKLKKEAEKSGKPKERRPFDRDIDLSANQFDEAKKKLMMKKAEQLNDRFSSGAQKFL